MSDLFRHAVDYPAAQRAIRDKCVHPTGTFVEFRKQDVEQSIVARFEEQVRLHPDHRAIKGPGYEITYVGLNRDANRLARAILAQQGDEPQPVVLLIEHGAQVITAILGVLKAGKAYVSLDPTFTRRRASYMLEDSQADLIVTNQRNLALAVDLSQNKCQLVNVDELDADISTRNLGLSISSDSLAHVIYTTGSTGQPKGVVHSHRNVLHMTMNHTNTYHICASDRLSFLYSSSFIGGGKDTFAALLNGATICPFDLKEEGFAGLADWLIEQEITTYRSASTLFRHFVSTLSGDEEFPNLRLIHLGNEPTYHSDVKRYRKYFSQDCTFAVGLGASEISPIRQYFVENDTQIPGSTVPSGYAFEGTEVLLLDDHGREVVVGHVGEIAVRSRYLAVGYWRRPDLTEAKFLPAPGDSERRIYLTGDLGRMLPDGCLEHRGRIDFQVKIRGYSVDIVGVEAALLDLDSVDEAAAIVREDKPGNQRLIAYLVPTNQPGPTGRALRLALAETLPDHMIPSGFIMLDALPLAPNGKLDRQALPAPGTNRPELGTALVGARTPVERALLEVWTEVLGLDEIGVHDSFLELGGDSLLAGQVVSRVISEFRVELPLRTLFQAPTVADMALVITQRRAKLADQADIDRMLTELEALSAEKAKQLLTEDDTSVRKRTA